MTLNYVSRLALKNLFSRVDCRRQERVLMVTSICFSQQWDLIFRESVPLFPKFICIKTQPGHIIQDAPILQILFKIEIIKQVVSDVLRNMLLCRVGTFVIYPMVSIRNHKLLKLAHSFTLVRLKLNLLNQLRYPIVLKYMDNVLLDIQPLNRHLKLGILLFSPFAAIIAARTKTIEAATHPFHQHVEHIRWVVHIEKLTTFNFSLESCFSGLIVYSLLWIQNRFIWLRATQEEPRDQNLFLNEALVATNKKRGDTQY